MADPDRHDWRGLYYRKGVVAVMGMTCKTCQTDILHCTEIADRMITADGEVRACRAYKVRRRTITMSVIHAVFIALAGITLISGIGYVYGHQRGWRLASEQADRDVNTMLKDGASGKQAFYLPGSKIKLLPRSDGHVNLGGTK